tara:strand:+ start:6808 stop:7050 length:243 start_codon:yes stop_codon:yes gene_type:complete
MKFRIVEQNGALYPERKTFLGWRRFDYLPTPKGVSTIQGVDGYGALDLDGARAMLNAYIKKKTAVIHEHSQPAQPPEGER